MQTPTAGLTYAELLTGAGKVASRLRDAGMVPGDRVAVLAEPGCDFAASLHGCLLAGVVAVLLDPRLTAGERAARMAGARLTLQPDALGGVSRDADPPGGASAGCAHAPTLGDPAVVVHTSGTSGAPRPVTLSYGNLLANALGSAAALGCDRDERWLCPLPLAHVGGLMVLIRSVVYATTAVLEPPPFDALRVAALLASDVTVASLVPTMLERVLATGPRASGRLRVVLLGGAPADRGLLTRARTAGLPVAQTYGLTEACSQVTVSEPGDVETAGRALPGVSATLSADGEIIVEGPTVAGGRVLRTGDLGRLDARGRLVVLGRRDDLIVSGGENVAPAEVEAVLRDHPAVSDAAVFGRPDAEWGAAVTAHVVVMPGCSMDRDDLRAFCAERLARYKVPKAIEQVDALPRTATGKLLRRELT